MVALGTEPVMGICHRPTPAVPPRVPPGTLRSSPPRSAKCNSMVSQFQMGVPGLMPMNYASIYIYIYFFIFTYTYECFYICIHMYVSICVDIYIYTQADQEIEYE